MEKKILINCIYILCCELAEKKVPFSKGQEILLMALNNDLAFLGIIPKEASENFTDIHLDIQEHLNLISDGDKKIIVENLLKEVYLMVDYLEKSYNYSLTFRERDIARYFSNLKNVAIGVLITFLEEGRSLKNEFKDFKKDYNKYASQHIGVIAKILDSNKSGLDKAIINRKFAAKELIYKYKSLSITDTNLRSIWENDKIINVNLM